MLEGESPCAVAENQLAHPFKSVMSGKAGEKGLSPLSHDVRCFCINVKDEDTASTCCVCCKILPCQTDREGKQTSKMHHSRVCGSMCLKILEQTLAFMQGFMLCKLLYCFLDKHQKSPQSDSRGKCHSNPDFRCESQSVIKSRKTEPPVTAVSLNETACLSSQIAVGTPCVLNTSSLQPASRPLKYDRRMRRPRQGTSDSSRNKKETKADVIITESKQSDTSEDVDVHSSAASVCRREDTLQTFRNVNNSTSDTDTKIVNQLELENSLCKVCGMKFSTQKSLEIHTRKTHRKPGIIEKMPCRICGKLYSRKGLINHINNQHRGEKAVECEVCGERFFRSRTYYKHLKTVHNKLDGMCEICGKHFKYANALREHMRAHAGIRDLVCELCGKSFVRITSLCDHKKLSHGHGKRRKSNTMRDKQRRDVRKKPPQPRQKLAVLQCRECKKTLEDIQAWRSHMEEHKLSRTNFCEICGKGFKTQASLQNHKQQHQEKRFYCDICNKPFTYKCNMKKHRESHSEDRPFGCEFCQKTFKNEKALNEHKAMHIEDRQYKCHICGKGFSRGNNLQRHVRTMHPGSDI